MQAAKQLEVDAFVQASKGNRAELSVGGVPGLVARVSASGDLTYAIRYRSRDTREQRTHTFGKVGLADARKAAKKLLADVAAGEDPWEARQAAQLAAQEAERAKDRTMARMVDLWLASKEAAEWRPGTRRETERLLRKHVVPEFGHRDPNDLTRGEVRKHLDGIAERAPSEANHAFAALRGLYTWLHRERQEFLGVRPEADPLRGMERPGGKPKERDRVYSDDEVRQIVAALASAPADVADLVELILHTGTRDGETRRARWTDIDMERGVWTVPADVAKNRRAHVVALSSGALTVLRRRPRFGPSRYVFPNPATSTGHMDRPNSKVLAAIAVAAGLRRNVAKPGKPADWEGDPLRLHDLRRTVGQRLRHEYGAEMMHGALGHEDAALTRTYGPTPALKRIAAAMEWWAGEVQRILGANAAEERRA